MVKIKTVVIILKIIGCFVHFILLAEVKRHDNLNRYDTERITFNTIKTIKLHSIQLRQ